jgi:N-acetylglucosaminyldiphosphoundecaprenol N-acetyl-beta-D-mannosaminyltransferase
MSEAAIGKPQRVEFLDVSADLFTEAELTAYVAAAIAAGRRTVIGNHNLHSLYLAQRDGRFREFFAAADAVYVDGMGVAVVGRLCGVRIERRHRITMLDWETALFGMAVERGWRVFFLGSLPEVATAGSLELRRRYPGLDLTVHHGHFDATAGGRDNSEIEARIAAARPDLLLVGMGMPRQEHWILEHRDRLNSTVMIPVGGYLKYAAGVTSTPPRWLGPLGLEWLYLLVVAPGRGVSRYLVEPWFLAAAVGRAWLLRLLPRWPRWGQARPS